MSVTFSWYEEPHILQMHIHGSITWATHREGVDRLITILDQATVPIFVVVLPETDMPAGNAINEIRHAFARINAVPMVQGVVHVMTPKHTPLAFQIVSVVMRISRIDVQRNPLVRSRDDAIRFIRERQAQRDVS